MKNFVGKITHSKGSQAVYQQSQTVRELDELHNTSILHKQLESALRKRTEDLVKILKKVRSQNNLDTFNVNNIIIIGKENHYE